MKSTILLIFVLSCLTAIGQINLENTYNDGIVNRVKLEISGEKYYLLDQSTKQVKLYNSDHTAWKTILLPTLVNPLDLTISHLSETKINADNNIEIAYSYYTENGGILYNSRIVNEEGTVLLNVSDASSIEVSEINGLPIKVIALIDDVDYSTKIYDVPALSLEHTYTGNDYVKRVKLENSGEKYYQLDELNNRVILYNSIHSEWNTISLSPINDAISLSINHISENVINTDNLIEVVYTSYDASFNFESKISNESGTTLLTIPDAFSLNVDIISGFSNKLIAVFVDFQSFSFLSKVHTLPSLLLEGTYNDGIVTRVKLENSGEKYYLFDALTNQVKLYNTNHSLWETLMLSSPIGATILGITHLSETKINEDSQIELAYSYSWINGSETSYTSVIINYNGSIYLNIPGALAIVVSQIAGLQNKLIVPMDGVPETSKVYGLPTTTLAVDKVNPVNVVIAIYPNPSNHNLTIESKNTAIKNFMITSVLGKIVKEVKQTSQSITVDVSDLSPGTYFMKGQTIDGVIFNRKIIIY
jgi:hypothetical protein